MLDFRSLTVGRNLAIIGGDFPCTWLPHSVSNNTEALEALGLAGWERKGYTKDEICFSSYSTVKDLIGIN